MKELDYFLHEIQYVLDKKPELLSFHHTEDRKYSILYSGDTFSFHDQSGGDGEKLIYFTQEGYYPDVDKEIIDRFSTTNFPLVFITSTKKMLDAL